MSVMCGKEKERKNRARGNETARGWEWKRE